jgi:2-phosphosulfolactate phosphatase
MIGDQAGFELRCEWGEAGLRLLGAGSDAVVIVDVLSFCTAVEVAVSRGAVVYPYRWNDPTAAALAAGRGALLAGPRSAGGLSLSPASLLRLGPGTRIVLPSLNGATLCLAAGDLPVFAGCLRNARAAAQAARACGPRIAVIPAGERWPDGSLRPALEDWIGAGAVLSHLSGSFSPEAQAAIAAYRQAAHELQAVLATTGSGRELAEAGFAHDLALAGEEDASDCAPRLVQGAFCR